MDLICMGRVRTFAKNLRMYRGSKASEHTRNKDIQANLNSNRERENRMGTYSTLPQVSMNETRKADTHEQ